MYAPLGTMMSLGDHVRISRAFLEVFKTPSQDYLADGTKREVEELRQLQADLKVCHFIFAVV